MSTEIQTPPTNPIPRIIEIGNELDNAIIEYQFALAMDADGPQRIAAGKRLMRAIDDWRSVVTIHGGRGR